MTDHPKTRYKYLKEFAETANVLSAGDRLDLDEQRKAQELYEEAFRNLDAYIAKLHKDYRRLEREYADYRQTVSRIRGRVTHDR